MVKYFFCDQIMIRKLKLYACYTYEEPNRIHQMQIVQATKTPFTERLSTLLVIY